ncbi:cellulose synthase subunit BcsC-related outer membrane protein [Noviherbaspirillum malthae]|uniref:cellulose synthase subunit BcsC-related outer membrane protein n=1 Tax=Noviherbaspirillum malthae TaxID=1260987 RepID=UPI001890755F|nr:cellulose synthase subunit BcsC-related outer membrane protein [Noviherbaspirillum malthae]
MQRKLISLAIGIGLGACAKGALAADVDSSAPTEPRLALKLSHTLTTQPRRQRAPAPRRAPLALRIEDTIARLPPSAPVAQLIRTSASTPMEDPAHAALLSQARLWESRNRDDLAIETLNKLLRSAPDHPVGLARLAYIYLRVGQKDKARQYLEQLRRTHPDHLELLRLENLMRLEEGDKDRLRQARMLAKTGRPEEALKILRQLYPGGPPTGDLTLEYWLIIGDTTGGWERALIGLTRLVGEYPENYRYRLALAEHITVRRPADPAALKTIRELAELPQYEKQARAAWRRAMLRLGPVPASVGLIEQYLAREKVEDSAVKEHLDKLKMAIEEQRRLMADPYYRAGLDGLAMLESGRLEPAEDKLSQSIAGRPRDPNVLGALGTIRMRQGHHAEAQAYFLEAQRQDPGSDRWKTMVRVARYWGLMREASDAADAEEFGLAEFKYREARTLDTREPAAIVGLGRTYAAQGRAADSEKAFREALVLEPANANALQGLVTLYLRTGREQDAEMLLSRLSGAQKKEFAETVAAVRATLFKEKAQSLLDAGRSDEALAMLERAAEFDRADPWLRFDMARMYAARGEADKGNALFTELVQRQPQDAAAHYAYALFLSNQERDVVALSTLERIAAQNRNENMTSLQRRLWVRVAIQRSLELAKNGRGVAARTLIDDAARAVGDDSELLLDLADARIDAGDMLGAKAALGSLAAMEAPSVDWSLRHARLTASAGADDAVPPLLDRLAGKALTPEQTAAMTDIRTTLALRRAEDLRRGNRLDEALALLAPLRTEQPASERLLSTEARFLRNAGRSDAAERNYRELLRLRPDNRDAEIALIEMLVETRQPTHTAEARQRTDLQLASLEGATPDQVADLVGILIELKDWERARMLVESALSSTPDNPRSLSYASELSQREGRIDDALDYLRRSYASEMSQREAAGAPVLSSLRQTPMPDGSTPPALDIVPAPAESLGTEAAAASGYRRMAELLDQKTTWLSGAVDKRTRSGSAGTSQYDATEIPLELKQATGPGGRWTYRADLVRLNAGGLDLSDTGSAETFGAALFCQPGASDCGTGIRAQRASGVALNAALERNGTRYDIGTTPLGFPVQNVVGGILTKGDLGPFGLSVDVSRRPLTGSVLSYAGTRDPYTKQTWGGVLATGVRFGLSLDEGGRFGGWSSLGLHRLTGRNVKDNNRMQLMAGGQWRVINEDDRLLQFGITGMYWRMSENAGEYTLGHGGYYSPGMYKSLSFPVTFGQRYSRFSYAIRGSISASRSNTKDAPYFPTDSLLQSQAESLAGANGVTPFYTGGRGRGVGRSLALSWEYQADPRMFLGGRIELDRSPDYSPNRFVFYLRYALDGSSAKPVSFLPEPISPTSQY